MRKIMIAILLLSAGCAARGYRDAEARYTVYRSHKMTPDGVLTDRHLDRPEIYSRDVAGEPSLYESYSAQRIQP